MRVAFRRCLPYGFFAALPIVLLALAAVVFHRTGEVGTDFRFELYPEGKLILHGVNPFPSPHWDPSSGGNLVFPVPGALLFSPLTLLTPSLAADFQAVLLLGMLTGTVWALGVRDWRIYGLLGLWPTTFAAIQSGNLTVPLALLVALAWRYRERRYAPGIAIGAAIALKLFLWPLLVWLLATRRIRSGAVAGLLGLGGGLLTVLPFISLGHYLRLLRNMDDTFGPQSYTLAGLLTQSHAASFQTAALIGVGFGLAVLALAYVRRSLPLAVGAALALSPIVWNHYFLLLLVPLALAYPRLSPAWFAPLALWVCPGLGVHVRPHHVLIALVVVAAVILLVETRRTFGRPAGYWRTRAGLTDSPGPGGVCLAQRLDVLSTFPLEKLSNLHHNGRVRG